jgi:hypothetical protein
LLSSVPTTLTSLNTGLDTLQFQSLSSNPKKPTAELLGGTQDNGTFLYEGSSVLWPETMGGDGGQSGFNATTDRATILETLIGFLLRAKLGRASPHINVGSFMPGFCDCLIFRRERVCQKSSPDSN